MADRKEAKDTILASRTAVLIGGHRFVKYERLISIIEDNGFRFHRTAADGKRHVYRGTVNGKPRQVVIAYTRPSEDVGKETLAAIIRNTGLPKRLFQ